MTEQLLKKIVKYLAVITLAGLLVWLSFLFLDLIVILIIALLVAMIFNPVVSYMENLGLPRILAVITVFLASGVLIFVGFSVLIPKLVSQMNTIAENVSRENVTQLIVQLEESIKHYIPLSDKTDFAGEVGDYLSTLLFNSFDNISTFLTSIVSVIAVSVIVPFIAFFLLKDKQKILKGLVGLMPNRYFEMSYSVIRKINEQLGRFVRAWILDAFLVGSLSALGLTILGIDNSITIGFIAGLGHLIPYFGPVIGGLPAVLISLIQFGDFSMLVPIVVMFIIIYTFDNGYIQPNVFSKGTDMHPLMIILLILAGSKIMGVLGMLLAVPVATVLKTAAREVYYGYKNYKIIRS